MVKFVDLKEICHLNIGREGCNEFCSGNISPIFKCPFRREINEARLERIKFKIEELKDQKPYEE